MRPLRSGLVLPTGLALSWCLAAVAAAQPAPLPFRSAVRAGGRAATVALEADAEGTRVRLEAGADRAELILPGPVTEAEVAGFEASAGPVVVVRAAGEAGARWAVVYAWPRGHARSVWSGRLDLRGDAGERSADALELIDRTGDGRPDVVVGVVREGLGRCGAPALLAPRALTSAGELRAVELRRGLPESVAAREAGSVSPGPSGEPLVRALRFSAATSTAGESDPRFGAPPRALTDGDPGTVWAEGRPGGGDGELVVGRWESATPVRALRLRAGPGVRLPRALSLVLGSHEERVTVPAGAADAWVLFEAPIEAACVALVIDEGDPGGVTGFGEVSAYTEPDFGRGLEALVDELVAEGPRGDDVAGWLGRLGEPACAALDASWERLGQLGRLRALRVAAAVRSDVGTALLARGAADPAAEVRAAALERLAARGAFDVVASLASGSGEAAEEAAWTLALADAPQLTRPDALLDALDAGASRPGLRAAAARIAARDETGLEAFFAEASPRALAAMALGLAEERLGVRERDARRALLARVATRAAPSASEFEDRFRLARAARALPGSALDGWLSEQVRSAGEWMQRDAALEALGARVTVEVLAHALADPYPRVRARALAIAGVRGDRAAIEAGTRDRWPTVRLAALLALGEADAARAALDDGVALVRVGAIELLTRLAERGAREAVEARLTDREEWPEVVRAGLSYVEALCLEASGPALAAVVRRGAREGAWAPDVDAALAALAVALRLGGEAAALAEEAARSAGASVAHFEPVLSRRDGFPPCR
jgi:hypothetical protein